LLLYKNYAGSLTQDIACVIFQKYFMDLGQEVCPVPFHGPLYHLCLTHDVNAGSRLACFTVDGVGAPLVPYHLLARTSFLEYDVSG
jgi:hypothetical protein